jgi:BASS family bile acid:Na+ symporter
VKTHDVPAPIRFLHDHFFAFLLASYAIAAAWPGPGLRLRGLSFGEARLGAESMRVTLPTLMLGLLLLNAGLSVRIAELKHLLRRPAPLLAGLTANLLLPIAFIAIVARTMVGWHNADEVQVILVGLALVASMPIAGSSTAWSQNAEGDLALSLGLVAASTLLSPLATPIALQSVGVLTTGEYAADLRDLASHGTGIFLVVCVLLPALVGITLRFSLGEERTAAVSPWLKTINSINLLALCYSNAAAALPQVLTEPDWDFLLAIVVVTGSLCLLAFGSGWGLGHLLGADSATRTSLMFGLGMNNNGTGLVLASIALADKPRVLLPVIGYNLVQQVVAAAVGAYRRRAVVAVAGAISQSPGRSGRRSTRRLDRRQTASAARRPEAPRGGRGSAAMRADASPGPAR